MTLYQALYIMVATYLLVGVAIGLLFSNDIIKSIARGNSDINTSLKLRKLMQQKPLIGLFVLTVVCSVCWLPIFILALIKRD
ncbi:MAG: hypothetical protein UV48_C0028G0011 [Candidatus Azambacteria bacterium GW2011_GWA2_42_9]|uniref:G-protein coupled receptors family 1 profile domain-containing protein n=1 Tax=Candidatus Azambacteria bacterium GW2011_GWA2_42_9 TaxID=1618613 RepID=A0A0G1DVE8_9BACT|nr:MAG: hypothetical protein UV48_C0028G0011 [Candidatus Azambacteria bacterium GW2011_GWA2_42_9]KKS86722.1 MAG: hypothetical protein UV62_C0038G0007 [Parcubacteria group bacterium GW2011_GWC1_43_11]